MKKFFFIGLSLFFVNYLQAQSWSEIKIGPLSSHCLITFDIKPTTNWSSICISMDNKNKNYKNDFFTRLRLSENGKIDIQESRHAKIIADNFHWKLGKTYCFRVWLFPGEDQKGNVTVEVKEVLTDKWTVVFKKIKQTMYLPGKKVTNLLLVNNEGLHLNNIKAYNLLSD